MRLAVGITMTQPHADLLRQGALYASAQRVNYVLSYALSKRLRDTR